MVAGAAVVGGLLVRLAAARGDLWIDEIGAFIHAERMRSVADAVLAVHSDNNHPLNTAWAYLVGPRRPSLVYRAPVAVAGAVSVALAGVINSAQLPADARAPRWRPVAFAAVLFASSYLLVQYDSEARGYAPALMLGLLGALAALRARWAVGLWTPVYALGMAGALLAQPLAIHLLAGALAWHAADEVGGRPGPALRRLAAWQGPPLAFGALLWAVHLRKLEIGGGPELSLTAVLGAAADHALGVPDAAPPALGLALAGLACAGGVLALRAGAVGPGRAVGEESARPPRLWTFYLVGILISPALLRLVTSNDLVYERYFLFSVALVLLLVGAALEGLARLGSGGRAAAVAVLLLCVAGSAGRVGDLVRGGRGSYEAPLRQLAAATAADPVLVGGNHDLWVGGPVQYFGPRAAGPGRRLVYLAPDAWPALGPHWFIWAWQSGQPPAPVGFEWRRGRGPRFSKVFETSYGGLSGFNWAVYRNDSRSTAAPAPSTGGAR